ncbi:neutral/alkaline non-lysosomal ceramidase N-terminal domain-containing protein [Paenibacillus eucommiae]|uniref:Neutral/alkaline non-lysosomal ceramidase N-terminal domain-containing protein n=1 Tax=Paenibacillus eucommiae TaxID=1355755 RepID=A0ABS4J2H1_9BACL|nr:neutral/alkaline non-lysosomal ceramidase N-terminal domain-containing protein [Paenibacillus eucommiae]MBP1994044.1 hypothetical protein [Paenibacillus eucommiae]
MKLLLGTAKVDITPENPIPLAGYSSRKGPYEGVRTPIYARIALFEQWEGEEKKQRLLVVSADLLWWGPEQMPRIRSKLAAEWGLRAEHVILSASHSHSGPQTSHRFPQTGLCDDAYLKGLEHKLLTGVRTAASNVEPVTVERGNGECQIGIHRRKMVDGQIVMLPNPEGPNDQEVTVIRFKDASSGTKALFVHFTCHPTVTPDNYLSAEYCGAAMRSVESALGDEAPALFLQGCTGDVRPALINDEGRFFGGSVKEVNERADLLAEAVFEVLNRPLEQLEPCALAGERILLPLDLAHLPTREELESLQRTGEEGTRKWAQQMLEQPELVTASIPLDIVRLDIAEGLSLLAMNGEMVMEYGLFTKEQSGGAVLPLGYSNGMVGYVSTAQQLVEGGYEATGSYYYFGKSSYFAPSTESKIKDSINLLVQGEKRGATHK